MMKKYQKYVALVLALVMVCALTACGGYGSANTANNAAAPAATTAPAAGGSDAAPAAAPEASGEADTSDWVKLNLIFATYLTEQNPCQANITVLQEKLDAAMPGMITIETYANNTLLKGADIYDGLLNGTCDIGLVQQDYTPARFPLSQILSYPGIPYNGAEVACRVFQDWARNYQPAEFQDVVFLMGIGSGPYCIYTSEPITSMADLAGKQIRAGAVNASMVADYGATPVTMDISEVYEAMRSGLIDGLYTNYGACAYQNLEDVGHYALVTPLNSNPSFYAMSKTAFEKMPASQQAVFMQCVDETFEEVTAKYQEAGLMSQRVADFAAATDRYFLEGDMLAEFQAANAHLMDDLVADLDAQGYDGSGTYQIIKDLADKYNQLMTWDDYKACFPDDCDMSNN